MTDHEKVASALRESDALAFSGFKPTADPVQVMFNASEFIIHSAHGKRLTVTVMEEE